MRSTITADPAAHGDRRFAGALLALLLLAAPFALSVMGCETPTREAPEPTGPRANHEAVLQQVRERGRSVERFDADLALRLTRADGARATLDGALCMARPDRYRMRSTKFGFLVCDVIMVDGEGTALLSSIVREQAQDSAEATQALFHLLGSLLGWMREDRGALALVSESDSCIVVRVPEDEIHSLEWTLARDDGRTLRVRRLDGEAVVGVLECRDHTKIDGIPIPAFLRFESATGRIDVNVLRPTINAPLNDDAFVPPAGAQPLSKNGANAAKTVSDPNSPG